MGISFDKLGDFIGNLKVFHILIKKFSYFFLINLSFLKEKYNMEIISDKIRENSILPNLERDYKGTAWLSFGLSLALYIFISSDREILERIKDENSEN